jgi:hypothetical protein
LPKGISYFHPSPNGREENNGRNFWQLILSDAGGLTDCGNINSRYPQALVLHCDDLLNCHEYYRVDASVT